MRMVPCQLAIRCGELGGEI